MTRYLTLFLILVCCTSKAQAGTDSLLHQLTLAIAKAPDYDAAKKARIDQLRTALNTVSSDGANTLFTLYDQLYAEYRLFNYDSAYRYANLLREIGQKQNNPHLITEARLQIGFILLSSGLFRETYDSLRITN